MKNKRTEPPFRVMISMHSIDREYFEITAIGFPDGHYDELIKAYNRLSVIPGKEEKARAIGKELNYLEAVKEMVEEDVGEQGDISKEIHKELWEKYQSCGFYCIEIKLWYTVTKDYFGEIDTDVDYEYKIF